MSCGLCRRAGSSAAVMEASSDLRGLANLSQTVMRRVPVTNCVLMVFVLKERRHEAVPCRHIPLNDLGETVDSLQVTSVGPIAARRSSSLAGEKRIVKTPPKSERLCVRLQPHQRGPERGCPVGMR